jgi:hypothetical protein
VVHAGRPVRSGGAEQRSVHRTGAASHRTRTARDRQRKSRSIGRTDAAERSRSTGFELNDQEDLPGWGGSLDAYFLAIYLSAESCLSLFPNKLLFYLHKIALGLFENFKPVAFLKAIRQTFLLSELGAHISASFSGRRAPSVPARY